MQRQTWNYLSAAARCPSEGDGASERCDAGSPKGLPSQLDGPDKLEPQPAIEYKTTIFFSLIESSHITTLTTRTHTLWAHLILQQFITAPSSSLHISFITFVVRRPVDCPTIYLRFNSTMEFLPIAGLCFTLCVPLKDGRQSEPITVLCDLWNEWDGGERGEIKPFSPHSSTSINLAYHPIILFFYPTYIYIRTERWWACAHVPNHGSSRSWQWDNNKSITVLWFRRNTVTNHATKGARHLIYFFHENACQT